MTELELDHVVIFSSLDAPEAKTLEALGLQGFGGVTTHGELGTASTSFFFSNLLYIELFWIQNPETAQKALEPLSINAVARMNWRQTGASPFGIMMRHKQAGASGPPPFATQQMSADWMPPGTYVAFNGETLAEPYYGIVPEALSFRGFQQNIQLLAHPLGVQRMTGVSVGVPSPVLSEMARWVEASGIISFTTGNEAVMTVVFDEKAQGKMADLRPVLPLIVKY